MLLSIASGKGGTGKTTLSLLLAATAPKYIHLVDCDVEEPNCHLFLKPQWQEASQAITVSIPKIETSLCNGCGLCSSICLFNAIALSGKKAMLFDELCHSCGGCLLACPQHAISEEPKLIGTVTKGISTQYSNMQLVNGTLQVGISSGVPLIKKLRQLTETLKGDVLLDCPPGTSCSMVTSINESDFCVLVTEPTPFGWHDLKLAMNITQLLKIPTGVVINKSDESVGVERIETFCKNRQVPVLAKIPHSLSFAQSYAAGEINDEFKEIAQGIWQKIIALRSERK